MQYLWMDAVIKKMIARVFSQFWEGVSRENI